MDTRLSDNFWLREFLRSETASRMGRAIEPPPDEIVEELGRLCNMVLEPVRLALGSAAITILSGWRPTWLNTAVGGSVRSDHLHGRAADIVVAGSLNHDVCARIKAMDLPVRQCILEFPPNGWVHVSVDRRGVGPKQQYLTAVKQGRSTVYLDGIRA